MKKVELPDSENEAKQNWYELHTGSFMIKLLEEFEKIAGFFKNFFVHLSRKVYTFI